MSPDRHSNNPDEWVEFAEDDLAVARARSIRPEYRCNHAQQAAEKAVERARIALEWAKRQIAQA